MPTQHDFERQINQILGQLSKVQGIDPSTFNAVRKDVEMLHRNISANAKEFKSTTRDIKDMRRSIMNAASAMEEQARIFHTDASKSISLQTMADNIRTVQDNLTKYMKDNIESLRDNDSALRNHERTLRQETRQREKLARMRAREEFRYIRRLKALNDKKDIFRSRISGIDQFSKGEVRQHGRLVDRADDIRRSPSQRRSSTIGANIVDDIPQKLLSRIRVKAMGDFEDKNIFQQLQDLRTFQTGKNIKETQKKTLGLTDARSTGNPLLRIYKAMEIESKSNRSRLIVVNMFKNSILTPIKTIGKSIEEAFIGLLNAPFLMLKKIGSSFSNVFGDIFTRLIHGKDALKQKISDRNVTTQEKRIDREEAFNDRLGIGVDRLASLLEDYTRMISTQGIRENSNQVNLNEIVKVNKEIEKVESKREIEVRDNFKLDDEESKIEVKSAPTMTKNTMGRAWEIARKAATTHGGSAKDFFDSSLKQAHEEKLQLKSQAVEQKADEEIQNSERQTELLKEIRDAIVNEEDQKDDDGGILGKLKGLLQGGLFKNLLSVLKGFGPKLLAALGLSKAGSILGAGKGLLGAASRAAPWAAAIYSIAKAVTETADEFVEQGSKFDNFLERFRLVSQNLVTALPGLFDSIMSSLFGFETNLKGFIDRLFITLNKIGQKTAASIKLKTGDPRFDRIERLKENIEKVENKEGKFSQMSSFTRSASLKKMREDLRKTEQELGIIEKGEDDTQTQLKNLEEIRRSKNKTPSVESVSKKSISGVNAVPIRVTSADTGKHREGSKHARGMAIDLTPPGFGGMSYNGVSLQKDNPKAFAAYERTADLLRDMGLKVVDEYSAGGQTSQFGSARHIHAEGSKQQIQDLINRAEIVKPGAIAASPNMKDAKTRAMLSASRTKLNNSNRTPQTEKTTPVVSVNPVINVPKPTIILDKDLDGSFTGWQNIMELYT